MVQGPNDLEALKTVLPANNTAAEAVARRHRPGGIVIDGILTQPADTVQLSADAVKAAVVRNVQNTLAAGGIAPTTGPLPALPVVPAVQPFPVAGPAATVVTEQTPALRSLAASWASSPAKNAVQNEPEVRPDRVAQAAQSLASMDGQGAGALNARIAEQLLING